MREPVKERRRPGGQVKNVMVFPINVERNDLMRKF